ncbi:MAG TPA: biotin--[acetyl-CoA-carboxylase] ligase [Candidatus Pelagibacter bacterium]|jgi:BirA family biotin operon repressor/biotin-[acetyl-CoA-carboxylase] ligase|nr:biotin--[acetyl-CoA-carboxylase] ligase [Pelagibacteraceae bacterium]HJN84466.1 biotin--[acetyl-CoA-carboxylase] ligase [Candidatus Pelagibacter bacterium]|tara:strand:- start:377 stop:910 length:534 start_codon:yes stop_codon:yes gene_type:complete
MKIKKFNYKSVNSTNDIAINLIKKKNIKTGYIFAEKQKKGRGQQGKRWISYKGNLFVSIFFSLEKNNLTLKQLTKVNAKLIIKLISHYYKKKIKIKLPNDILIKQRKICGILQETVQKNGVTYLIVGIGLNLVKSPNIKNYPTTSLYELTKTKISAKKISNEFVFIYNNFLKTKKFF